MDDAIEIEREETPTHGLYRARIGDAVAKLTWRARGTTRVADHTYTPPELRGRGIAAKLVEARVADARAQGFTIDPKCPYVEAAFARHPEWADLRAGR